MTLALLLRQLLWREEADRLILAEVPDHREIVPVPEVLEEEAPDE